MLSKCEKHGWNSHFQQHVTFAVTATGPRRHHVRILRVLFSSCRQSAEFHAYRQTQKQGLKIHQKGEKKQKSWMCLQRIELQSTCKQRKTLNHSTTGAFEWNSEWNDTNTRVRASCTHRTACIWQHHSATATPQWPTIALTDSNGLIVSNSLNCSAQKCTYQQAMAAATDHCNVYISYICRDQQSLRPTNGQQM